MNRKKIFYKKSNNFIIRFLIFIILIFSIIYYYNFYINNENFLIKENNNPFYEILEETGGKKIPDYGIDFLENNQNNSIISELNNINFSIQLETSDSINHLNSKVNQLINNNDFELNKFFIIEFNNEISTNYLLLYDNFNKRDSAVSYCNELKSIDIRCLVVNVKNL
tara:strand:+ start:55 stop:555 length:501 start_codon:yes stop_codon:yes gene_type:complete